MSIIEGFGDEVVYFFLGLLVAVIIGVAWATTDHHHQWQLRTVYLLDGRRLDRLHGHIMSHLSASPTIPEEAEELELSRMEEVTRPEGNIDQQSANVSANNLEAASAPSTSHRSDEENIIRKMDSTPYNLRQRRRVVNVNSQSNEEEPRPNTARSFTGNIADLVQSAEDVPQPEVPDNDSSHAAPVESKPEEIPPIYVKLKYLNDTLRVVSAVPNEKLGQFRQKHFANELSENKLVKLVFNGHILHHDGLTLANHGMFNNCVVHCIIRSQEQIPANIHEAMGDNMHVRPHQPVQERDWDLGNLLIATVSFSLGSAWYFRYQYPQLFTVTATIGLVALTGIFTVISAGIYFPEIRRARRRDTPPEGGDH